LDIEIRDQCLVSIFLSFLTLSGLGGGVQFDPPLPRYFSFALTLKKNS